MDTTRMGTLYVVTGDLLNPGTLARAPGQAVQVSLLGQDGGEVNLSLAFAGRDVQLDALREMSVEQLWGSQRVTALALAGDEIGPGQSASFAAAFVSLPEEASHFQLGGVAVEQINEIAIARGVTIPVAPVEVVLDSDGIELDPAAMETEVGESEIGAEPRAPLEPKPAE